MEKNLIKQAVWYNPFCVIATNGKPYELDNIIIYDENGLIVESGHGWFNEQYNNNNSFNDGLKIQDIHLRKKIDFTKKENFIIKDEERTYETRYILYIYYKNVDFKAIKVNKDGYWIYGLYEITIEDKKIICEMLYGKTDMKSENIKYDYYKTIDAINKNKYNNTSDLMLLCKELEKQIKKFEKVKEQEKEDINKNIYEFIYDDKKTAFNKFITLYLKEEQGAEENE